MSDRLPGATHDNPIRYRDKWSIYPGPAYTDWSRWEFVHDDYDGAPDDYDGSPGDGRHGFGESFADCQGQIDELMAEASPTRARSTADAALKMTPTPSPLPNTSEAA